jgi:HK97 family phage prohead protease
VRDTDLQAFRRTYGSLGETERRTVTLTSAKATPSGSGDGRLHIVGHAAVFNSPSVQMRSHRGTFTEYIERNAFDGVLRANPDVLLTWDHNTSKALARTNAGTLELSANTHGLRYFASVTPTSYAEDLRSLMNDGVISQSSFTFSVAKGGEEWSNVGDTVVRRIRQIDGLYDVCVCAAGAYPTTDSGIARTLFLQHALKRGLLKANPDAALRASKLRAELELRRRKLNAL